MYKNQILGDKSTPVVAAELTPFEQETLRHRIALNSVIQNTQNIIKTKQEFLTKLLRDREQLQLECQHHAFDTSPNVCSLCGYEEQS